MPRVARPWFNKNTNWWCTDISGRRVKLLKGGPSDARRRTPPPAVLAEFHRVMAECAVNPPADSGPEIVTVPAILDEYLDLACRENEPRTFQEKKALLQRFAADHRDRRAAELKPYDLEKWLAAHPGWKSDDYRAKVCSTVHAAFNWAARGGLLGKGVGNPMAGFTVAGGNRRRPMSGSEFRRIWGQSRHGKKTGRWRTAGRRYREVLFFIRLTGARPKEVRDLLWTEIDAARGLARIQRHKTSKKTRKERIIPLTVPILRLLRAIGERDGTAGVVFKTTRGGPWARNSLAQKIKRLRDAVGVPDDASLYGLRHRFGTRAHLQGVDLKTLADLMGHTRVQTTEHYLHTGQEFDHLREAMARVSGPRRRGPGA
jgi:integrase